MTAKVTGTETTVTGLTAGIFYTFSVTAENDASSQDYNMANRTATITATTEEGGWEKHSCFEKHYVCVFIWEDKVFGVEM